MKMSRPAVASVVLLVPLAVACSSSKNIAQSDTTTSPTQTTTTSPSPTEPTTPSASASSTSPDDSGRLEGSAFSVTVPAGWEDITASLKRQQPTVDVAMGIRNAIGFRTNFNVINNNSHPGTIEDNGPAIRKEAAIELRSITKKAVTSLPDRTIDGEAAIGQTSTFVTSGTPVTFIQYFVVHHGSAYPVTMTFANDNAAAAKSLLNQILASWQWES